MRTDHGPLQVQRVEQLPQPGDLGREGGDGTVGPRGGAAVARPVQADDGAARREQGGDGVPVEPVAGQARTQHDRRSRGGPGGPVDHHVGAGTREFEQHTREGSRA
ncbi:hypothetical protein MTP03_00990 [Tsukamurella sp. PLM1]|nr:hypothetical protein MTP03_00990 [Tsukamurella sp. PLM1]